MNSFQATETLNYQNSVAITESGQSSFQNNLIQAAQQTDAEMMDKVLAGHYQIVKPLGGGGFGQTFLAKDTHLPGHPICVVKQLKPGIKEASTLDIAKRLFDREAETLYRLGNHDQIPRLLAHFEQDNEFFLVQDYVAGDPLDRVLIPGKQHSETTVVEMLQDILNVLAFVHQQQVIHRDIKPSNLIRRHNDNRIVLIDFGAVKQVSSHTVSVTGQTSMTVAIGSPGYMPSEQQAFHPHFSSDIYAVGIVCMQALSGLAPKLLPRNHATNELSCAAFSDRASVSPGLAAIIDRMVRYDYRQRFQSAIDAFNALHDFLNEVSGAPTVVPTHYSVTAMPTEALAQTLPPDYLSQLPPATIISRFPTGPQNLPDDVKRQLERLMAEIIGPIASVVLRTGLAKSVTLEELMEYLMARLPAEQRSQFQQRVEQMFQPYEAAPSSPTHPQSTPAPATPSISPTAQVTPQFIKQCELELAKRIGPIANLLVRRAIAQNPHRSAKELVDVLSTHLPEPAMVESFRQSLLTLL